MRGVTTIYREESWPLFIIGLLLFFCGFFFLMAMMRPDPSALVLCVVCGAAVVGNQLTRRRIVLSDDGLAVGRLHVPWDAIEAHEFREIPRMWAGLLIRLSPSYRQERGWRRGPSKKGEHGQYDLYVRATGDLIVALFLHVERHLLQRDTRRLAQRSAALVEAARVQVEVVIRDPMTLAILTPQLVDRLDPVVDAIKATMEEVRWDPEWDGRVMLLIGPVVCAQEVGAEAALEELKGRIAEVMGPRATVEALFAEREVTGGRMSHG